MRWSMPRPWGDGFLIIGDSAGVLNSHYWFDPKADIIGLLMTQSLPFVDPRFASTYEKFERAAYRHALR